MSPGSHGGSISRSGPRTISRAAAALAAALVPAVPLPAQSVSDWNDERTLELVKRAGRVRDAMVGDSALQSYAAKARGYVYFYMDEEGSEEKILVKVDQLALDVYWKAPNWTKQEIVGLRDEKKLPTDIKYHLDHLTVVQDDFGQLIRLGDGDEVRGVLHPIAPRGLLHYDYRLVDSLTVTLPAPDEPVRVYEVEVRPEDPEQAGIVGSIFLDRKTAAIVRMRFTFTPSSYVDPRLDYIRISLENALWEGRYWLPYRQEAEIRRQFRYLDFPVGGVIRGRMEIGEYRLNPDLSREMFAAGRVVSRPPAARERFPFERGLYADLEEEGLDTSPDLEEVRSRAASLVRTRILSGIRGLRLWEPSASEALRFNRAEGLVAGVGFAWTPLGALRTAAHGAWAFGAEELELLGMAEVPVIGGTTRLTVEKDRFREIGPVPGSSGVVNTFGALLFGEDYVDPYLATGARLSHHRSLGAGWRGSGRIWLEDHAALTRSEAESPVGGEALRAVRPVEEGREGGLRLEVGRSYDREGWAVSATTEAGRFDPDVASGSDDDFIRLLGRVERTWRWLETGRRLSLSVRAGAAFGDAPVQRLFLFGGRGTLPGYPYRSFQGDRFWLARATGSTPLLDPWVALRGFVGAGATAFDSHDAVTASPSAWRLPTTDGVRPTAGLGLALVFDIVRLDVARGLDDGEWEVIAGVNHRFWNWL